MSRSHSNAERLLISAFTYDFAFEILQQLKTHGLTTDELVNNLPGSPARRKVSACLDSLQRAGLLFRFRSDGTSEWWVNRKGIADAAARLTEIAAMIPERDLEMISEMSRQNTSVSRLIKFFAISYRRDILRTLQRRPATPGEIYKSISPGVGPNAIHGSLRTLEEFGLVAVNLRFIDKPAGGFCVKLYNITHKGTVTLDALQSDRSLLDILTAVKPCEA